MRTLWAMLTVFSLVLLLWWNVDDRGYAGAKDVLKYLNQDFDVLSQKLRDYAIKTGEYPTNDNGLEVILKMRFAELAGKPNDILEPFNPIRDCRDICRYFKPTRSGFEDTDGVPLVYENRRGMTEPYFSASPLPVGLNSARWFPSIPEWSSDLQWWRKVDEGIFIFSYAAKSRWEYTRKFAVIEQQGSLVILVLFFFFGRLYLGRRRAEAQNPKATMAQAAFKTVTWFVSGFLMLVGFTSMSSFSTCYMYSPWGYGRDPEKSEEYVSLIESFAKEGVIKPETACKLKKVLSKDAQKERWDLREKIRHEEYERKYKD